MYGLCLDGLNGHVQWPERLSLRSEVQLSNTFPQPLLVTSFYSTILSSVYRDETTIDSSSIRGTNASCWKLHGQQMTRCVSTIKSTNWRFQQSLWGALELPKTQCVLTKNQHPHSIPGRCLTEFIRHTILVPIADSIILSH